MLRRAFAYTVAGLIGLAGTATSGVYFEAPISLPIEVGEIVQDGAGTWLAVANQSGDIVAARSTDGGRTWSGPILVDDGSGSDFSWSVAPGGAGRFMVVRERNFTVYAFDSFDGGLTWSAPLPVFSDVTLDDPGLLVASGGTGTWLLVTAPPSHVFDCDYQVRRSGDDGATWSMPIPLAVAPGGSCNALNVMTDGVGAWVSAWHSDDALGGTVGTDLDIHVARSVDDGMTWSAPAPLNTTAATDGADSDRSPRLATDRAGRWVAVWESRNTLGGTLSPLPTPADHHLLVSHSTDGGVTWTPPFALNPRAATELDEETPAELVTDGAGIWLMYGSYPPLSAVTVSRSVDHGLTWTEPTVLHGAVTIGNTTFENPAGLATDGSGTWVAGIQRGDVFVGTTLCTTARPDCVAPVVAGKAKLAITDKTPNVRDGLKWAWLAGDATTLADLGDPLATTTYTLCIYDAAGRVITGSRVPPGGMCSGKPCWRATATGFVYKAGALTDSPFGISKMKLRAGDAGKAKVVLGARGESLATPPLGGTQKPLVAQLEASDTGACWEATYSTALKETPLKLKARAD